MNSNVLKVFTGNANPGLAQAICEYLDVELGRADVRQFSDGETNVELGENVRGMDCFVIQSVCHPANTHLMELLIVIDALRRSSARRITAVIPYYGYARQDRKVAPRTPITAKLVADLISVAGTDRVLCLDLHAGQIQGFFNLPVDNLYATPVLLGGPKFQMMGPLVYGQFAQQNNWPFGGAISFILMISTLLLTMGAHLIVQRRYRSNEPAG